MTEKFFTPEEANKLLPYVIKDIKRLQQVKKEYADKAVLLRRINNKYGGNVEGAAADEMFRLEAGMEFLQLEAKTLTDSIRLKGAELKDIDSGLVDFPTLIDGKEVLLCWKLGEERIEHYHGREEGYWGRKPLS